jgi:hypothetical protein
VHAEGDAAEPDSRNHRACRGDEGDSPDAPDVRQRGNQQQAHADERRQRMAAGKRPVADVGDRLGHDRPRATNERLGQGAQQRRTEHRHDHEGRRAAPMPDPQQDGTAECGDSQHRRAADRAHRPPNVDLHRMRRDVPVHVVGHVDVQGAQRCPLRVDEHR